MRLRDLDAQFVCNASASGFRRSDSASVDGMQGVMFQCPSCGAGLERGEEDGRRFIRGAHYIMVYFSNPRGVDVAPEEARSRGNGTHNPMWTMSGTSLDDLSTQPSINCDIPYRDANGVDHPSVCKFHGYITNGDVT